MPVWFSSRWVRRTLATILIGVVVNFMLTWAIAVSLPIGLDAYQGPTEDRGYAGSVPQSLGSPSRAFVDRRAYGTYWQVQWDGPDPDEFFKDEAVAHIYRLGFPFNALESRYAYVGPQSLLEYDGPASFGGVPIPDWRFRFILVRTRNTPYAGEFPWLPIWPGFLANTALYGTSVLVVWLALSRWRRRRRVRRGLCTECAYELAGLRVCPECGLATNDMSREPA